MSLSYQTITTPRLTTAYLASGTPGKPRLLLLHGNVSSAIFYEHMMELLAEDFEMLAPDFRCFGHSSALPIDATRGLRDFSDDIEDFVVVEGDLSNGLQEESKASHDEFSTKQDVMADSNSDLNVINEDLSTRENDFKVHLVNGNYSEPSSDFNKNISKNCDNVVDSKYDKSALEKLKNNITILQDKLKAKKEDLKSTKIQNDAANIELKTAREEIENVFKNLFNYS